MTPDTDFRLMRPRDVHDLFRHFQDDFYALRRRLGGRQVDVWHPPTDVYETAADIVIKMSIPGVRPEYINIGCNGATITICGMRRGPDPGTVLTYHQMEIRNGYFERRIVLHKGFNPAEATARYEDGFLYVNIPKAEEGIPEVLTIEIRL